MSESPAVLMQGLHKSYGSDEQRTAILRGIDLRIERGEFVAIVGPSGSGKSTLLNLIGCLDGFEQGDYHLLGHSVADANDDQLSAQRRRHLGFVFQSFQLLPGMSALDNVCLPLSYSDIPRREWHACGMHLLEQFGLGQHAAHTPAELSGGQQQRVALARALIAGPQLLLADEPTGSLDQRNGEQVVAALEQLVQQGLTLIMVTHDPAVAARAHRRVRLLDGEIHP